MTRSCRRASAHWKDVSRAFWTCDEIQGASLDLTSQKIKALASGMTAGFVVWVRRDDQFSSIIGVVERSHGNID